MPPSFLILQKWTTMNTAATRGRNMQWTDVEPEERGRPDLRPAEQDEPDVVVDPHTELGAEGALMPEQRRGPGHVGPDGDRPDGKLVPGEKVTGEATAAGSGSGG